jgi:osmotically-inducible protein OsmY
MDPLSRDSWRNEADARYGERAYRDYDDERRRFNDRWENSYSGPGYGRFSEQARGEDTDYGGSDNPFFGDRPLLRAGSEYEGGGYFGDRGLPKTPWQSESPTMDVDDIVYSGRSMDDDAFVQRRGEFRGKGPRGYRRSDERIKEDVCQCLTDDQHIDATNIDVAVADREVVLSGTVTSRAQKRHAEDLIERLPGVRDVINGLRVVAGETQGSQGTQSMGTQSTRLGGTFR